MSIDIAAKKAGIELVRDVPKPHQRKAKDWAILIGTARKLEAAALEIEREATRKEREAHAAFQELSMQVVQLTQDNARLVHELEKCRMSERLRDLEVPPSDRKYLMTGERNG